MHVNSGRIGQGTDRAPGLPLVGTGLALAALVTAAAGRAGRVLDAPVPPPGPVAAHPQVAPPTGTTVLLSNGTGDGSASVRVDPYGAFGAGSTGGDFVFDPIGPQPALGTFELSRVWFSGAAGAGTAANGKWLDRAVLGEGTFTEATPNRAVSGWDLEGLHFDLEQQVLPPSSGGTMFRQTYVVRNNGAAPADFDLIRYADPDLPFDGSSNDLGGVNGNGQQVYALDRQPGAPDQVVVFAGVDLNEAADLGFQVEQAPQPDIAAAGRGALTSTLRQNGGNADLSGDRLTESAYDVALALGRNIRLQPGQSFKLVTNTLLGQGRAQEIVDGPTGLTAVPASDSGIDLRWTDNSTNEFGFDVERREGNGPFVVLATVGQDQGFFQDRGLKERTTYTYRVRAAFPSGTFSPWSGEATATTPLRAPNGLTALPVSQTQIALAWADNSNAETGYRVERRSGSGGFGQVVVLGPNVSSYLDSDLQANTTYTYRVLALGDGVNSAPSNESSATTPPNSPGGAPTNLQVDPVSTSSLALSWQDNSTDETGFRIERRTGQGAFGQLDTVGPNITTYVDVNLIPNTTYTYRVQAINPGGGSDFSNLASGTTFPLRPTAAPTNLRVTGVCASIIFLEWDDNSDNEAGFEIERLNSAGVFTRIDRVDANETEYTDENLSTSTSFTYRVRAVNAGGASDYSNEATGTTLSGVSTGSLVVSQSKLVLAAGQTKSFTLKNVGKNNLSGVVGSPASPFTLIAGRGAFVLKPGQSKKVTVQCAGDSSSQASAEVDIRSTDRRNSRRAVKLQGK